MKTTQLLFGFLLLFSTGAKAQDNQSFTSVKEVLSFAKTNNYAFQNAAFQSQLAELTKKGALGNALNPRIATSAQMLDNINQQVSFLPGQAFGLPEGTFKEVIIGQKYVSTFSIQPQFDILNLSSIAQIKSAKINQELVENQNKLNEQSIYEKINAVYFNILSFQAQKEILEENIKTAEQIKAIVDQKFKEGVARKQEVNEAEVNVIVLQDKLEQIEANISIQNKTLALFFENKLSPTLEQSVWDFEKTDTLLQIQNNLKAENAKLQTLLARQDYKALKAQNLPVLSFVSSFNVQNLSNESFFSNSSNWIDYSYVGLKLQYNLPTTVQQYTNLRSKTIQVKQLQNNEQYSFQENETLNSQLLLEFEKAKKQASNFKKIVELKKDTFEKNTNQYNENILPLDKLLLSQTDYMNSKLNLISTLANIGYSKTKIEIYNSSF